MIKKLIKKILCYLPVKDIIIFESAPDFSDNTKPVFDEMIKRGLNKKYKFYWILYDDINYDYPHYPNVEFIQSSKILKVNYLRYRAKIVISCNRFIGTNNKKQTFYYLTHGSALKDHSGYYYAPDYVDYVITDNHYMINKVSKILRVNETKCIPLGLPRNDIFTSSKIDLSLFFGKFKKYIIWYPTVKQFACGINYGIQPIPFFDNDDNVIKLNDCAKNLDVLIIIKPHFAQIKNIDTTNYSNIRFINDNFYKEHKLNSYQFIGSFDALLSDYSSVIFDYMLCDKPIGLIWEDIDVFKKNIGFIDGYENTTAGCEKIYSFIDLCNFINSVAIGEDKLKEKREEVNKMLNSPRDGKSASRVVDFIIEKSNLNSN